MKNVQVSWEQLLAGDDFRLECWKEIFLNIVSKSHGGTSIKAKYNTCHRWILIFPVPFPCSSLGHIFQRIYTCIITQNYTNGLVIAYIV